MQVNIRHIARCWWACLCAVGMAGCGRAEADQQQAKAMERFEAAWTLQEQAASGVVYEKNQLQEDEQGILWIDRTIEEYRQEKQEQAASQAQQITGSALTGPQRAAARLVVAQTQASTARKLGRAASLAWTRQADLHMRLINTASSIALAADLARQHGQVTFEQQIATAQQELDAQQREHQQRTAAVRELQEQAQKLEEQVQQLRSASRQKSAEADELARRAFTARGQVQYDLYVRSAEATNEADDLTARADGVRAELDLVRSRLTVEQAREQATASRIESLNSVVAALRKRAIDSRQLADDAQTRAEDLVTQQFEPRFQQLTAGYVQNVAEPFDAAVESMRQAVESAEAAAASDSRADIRLHSAAMRTEMGMLLRQRHVAERGYHDLLSAVLEPLSTARPALGQAISETLASSQERLEDIAQQAEDSLTKAVEELTPLAEGEGEAARLPLRYLLHASQALVAVTGNDEYRTQAEQASQRLNQIGQPREQPAP